MFSFSSLSPDTLCRACCYPDTTGKQRQVSWIDSHLKYSPLYNMGPRDVLPCLVAGSHFQNEDERVLCPMMWGMIPPWYQGDYKTHSASTHNSRLQGITSSKLYSPPLRKGQRCVVVCEGYYEWKAGIDKKEKKQPYYIYTAQEKGIKADDPTTWSDEWDEEAGWKGLKPLKMAGIFNTFKTGEGKLIYSCTIITRDSNNVLSWIHHRVPLILIKEDDIKAWLDKEIPMQKAVNMINEISLSEGTLAWHPVSTMVNNVRHKSKECRMEISLKEETKTKKSNNMLMSWLQKGSAETAKRKNNGADDTDNNSVEEQKSPKIVKKE